MSENKIIGVIHILTRTRPGIYILCALVTLIIARYNEVGWIWAILASLQVADIIGFIYGYMGNDPK